MNHLLGGHQRGVTGDLNRSAPTAFGHAREIHADKPHCRKDIHFEIGAPLLVGDLAGRYRAEDAEVVHQDVDVGKLAPQLCRAVLRRHVDGDAYDVTAQFGDGFLDALRRAPVHRDPRTAVGQSLGNGEARCPASTP